MNDKIYKIGELLFDAEYTLLYGVKCDTLEKSMMAMFPFLGITIIVFDIFLMIEQYLIFKEEWDDYNSKYEFYLFKDVVRNHNRFFFIKVACFYLLMLAFGFLLSICLFAIAIPSDTPYEFWRWVANVFGFQL